MKDKDFCRKYHIEIIKYYTNAICRRILKKNFFEQHYSKSVLSRQQGNNSIREMIISGKPFMAARFGGNEIRALSDIIFERSGGKVGGLSKRSRNKLVFQAGFFPNEKEMFEKFADIYLEACKEVDLIGVWNMFLQGEITKRYLSNALYSDLAAVEPFYFDNPWSELLKGKKVLVVHPFTASIEQQYQRRELIYPGKNVLPEFELVTVKAVQTIAGAKDPRFDNWFQALDYMYKEAMEKEFDIALIGCGAYGYPLAAKLKKAGKQVIHMGGALQILFGIKGARWDNHETISKLYNEFWIRPSEQEKVENNKKVEAGCYW